MSILNGCIPVFLPSTRVSSRKNDFRCVRFAKIWTIFRRSTRCVTAVFCSTNIYPVDIAFSFSKCLETYGSYAPSRKPTSSFVPRIGTGHRSSDDIPSSGPKGRLPGKHQPLLIDGYIPSSGPKGRLPGKHQPLLIDGYLFFFSL